MINLKHQSGLLLLIYAFSLVLNPTKAQAQGDNFNSTTSVVFCYHKGAVSGLVNVYDILKGKLEAADRAHPLQASGSEVFDRTCRIAFGREFIQEVSRGQVLSEFVRASLAPSPRSIRADRDVVLSSFAELNESQSRLSSRVRKSSEVGTAYFCRAISEAASANLMRELKNDLEWLFFAAFTKSNRLLSEGPISSLSIENTEQIFYEATDRRGNVVQNQVKLASSDNLIIECDSPEIYSNFSSVLRSAIYD